jgi:hypothetical protein
MGSVLVYESVVSLGGGAPPYPAEGAHRRRRHCETSTSASVKSHATATLSEELEESHEGYRIELERVQKVD